MTRKVKRESAKSDIIELADYIAYDSLETAEDFIAAAEATFRFLAQTPGAGAIRDYLNPSLAGLRMWPIRGFEKHLVFYQEVREGWKSFVCFTQPETLRPSFVQRKEF